MRPRSFQYWRAQSTAEAVELLDGLAGARVLAGGLSLIPLLRRRKLAASHLVDINGIADLGTIRPTGSGMEVGACVRQASCLDSGGADRAHPLLREALHQVGNRHTRARGTVLGIVAHGEPAGQLAAVCAAIRAEVVQRSIAGERVTPAVDFFIRRPPGTPLPLLTGLRVPSPSPGEGSAFRQVNWRASGPALAGVAVRVVLNRHGRCTAADLAPFAPGHDGTALPAVAEQLIGTDLDDGVLRAAAQLAGRAIGASNPTHHLPPSGYLRHAIEVLARRALATARERAVHQARQP